MNNGVSVDHHTIRDRNFDADFFSQGTVLRPMATASEQTTLGNACWLFKLRTCTTPQPSSLWRTRYAPAWHNLLLGFDRSVFCVVLLCIRAKCTTATLFVPRQRHGRPSPCRGTAVNLAETCLHIRSIY